ncbi:MULTISPECIES: hypothetical protein [Actinokineospora]|uniref:DNA-binding transcriptional regulator of glucitol operon n=1 Tax=Actinokineospora fastidiosa TaxID=1816 RepID=A0A918GIH3_9PSEU|nr:MULTISPECIES: hypothetical protein [Actinokineospora]UVS80816.1 Glucitol operon activator [Actinokineospora sp. UTMC 2448]GGS37385.1 hypothetical protein GCM10010171_35340 [Actinokineospora fastidiosa]
MLRKVVIVGVSLLSLVAACALAWWQWDRFTEANGTFQNLGYVLQWPLFGLAPAYMFWRWHRLRTRPQDPVAAAPPPPPPRPVIDDSGDDELAAYNRYLARLHENQEPR